MPRHEVLPLIIFFGVLLSTGFGLGHLMAIIMEGRVPAFLKFLSPVEKIALKLSLAHGREQRALDYLKDLLVFNLLGFLFVLFVLMSQGVLPLNPQAYPGLSFPLAFNTAVSFMTNTNWQAYSGEASLSNFSQMVALASQNFLSAATGLAVIVCLARGLSRKEDQNVGNFAVDVTRITIYLFLPLSFLFALVLVSQGVVQSFDSFPEISTLEGIKQVIPLGPAASQIAIKQIGTNGGGFFGVNSAHPFENPTPFSNFLQTLAILLFPVAQVFAFGKLLKRPREGWSILLAMLLIFIPLLCVALWAEHSGIPGLGATMEGKEVRFGVTDSVLWGVSTTAASNGSVNGMHSSFTPLAGLVFIFQMLTGEVVLGGVGAGLYGMALYIIITLFLAGLMVGRSPEWLGKKIEAREVKLALIAILIPSAMVLLGVALGAVMEWGTSSLSHSGPHGLSELIYTFASTVGNNGSAFGGFNANTPFLNMVLGICMLAGRFLVIIPVILIAGSMGQKKIIPQSSGTFPTDGGLFPLLLVGVVLIFGALTFFPLLALGPIAEHLLMLAGQYF